MDGSTNRTAGREPDADAHDLPALDPYQWGRLRNAAAVGEMCHGRTVAQVVESNIAAYTPGDYVFNTNGWQTHGLSGEGVSVFTYMFPRQLDPSSAPIVDPTPSATSASRRRPSRNNSTRLLPPILSFRSPLIRTCLGLGDDAL